MQGFLLPVAYCHDAVDDTQLDPVSGGLLVVSTLVNAGYAHLIKNFALHMQAVLPCVTQYTVYTLDPASEKQCQKVADMLPHSAIVCKIRYIEDRLGNYQTPDLQKGHYDSPVFQYKTELTRDLIKQSPDIGASVLMDITNYILSKECWSELLHYPENFVASASKATPRWFADKYGYVFNTGLTLSRKASMPLLSKWYQFHLDTGGPQQAALATVLDEHEFGWNNGSIPKAGDPNWTATCTQSWQVLPTVHEQPVEDRARRTHTTTLRMLNYYQWPRAIPDAPAKVCSFHPFISDHKNHKRAFEEAGLWYGDDGEQVQSSSS
jgi:hypothetical protein